MGAVSLSPGSRHHVGRGQNDGTWTLHYFHRILCIESIYFTLFLRGITLGTMTGSVAGTSSGQGPVLPCPG